MRLDNNEYPTVFLIVLSNSAQSGTKQQRLAKKNNDIATGYSKPKLLYYGYNTAGRNRSGNKSYTCKQCKIVKCEYDIEQLGLKIVNIHI